VGALVDPFLRAAQITEDRCGRSRISCRQKMRSRLGWGRRVDPTSGDHLLATQGKKSQAEADRVAVTGSRYGRSAFKRGPHSSVTRVCRRGVQMGRPRPFWPSRRRRMGRDKMGWTAFGPGTWFFFSISYFQFYSKSQIRKSDLIQSSRFPRLNVPANKSNMRCINTYICLVLFILCNAHTKKNISMNV
jgi:hypothetical protein